MIDTTTAWNIAITIILFFLSGFAGVIGYFLKDIKDGIKEKQDSHDRAIEKVREDFSSFKARMPQEYVMRDDFLRAISNLEFKFDKVATDITEINKNVSKLLAAGGEKT